MQILDGVRFSCFFDLGSMLLAIIARRSSLLHARRLLRI